MRLGLSCCTGKTTRDFLYVAVLRTKTNLVGLTMLLNCSFCNLKVVVLLLFCMLIPGIGDARQSLSFTMALVDDGQSSTSARVVRLLDTFSVNTRRGYEELITGKYYLLVSVLRYNYLISLLHDKLNLVFLTIICCTQLHSFSA